MFSVPAACTEQPGAPVPQQQEHEPYQPKLEHRIIVNNIIKHSKISIILHLSLQTRLPSGLLQPRCTLQIRQIELEGISLFL